MNVVTSTHAAPIVTNISLRIAVSASAPPMRNVPIPTYIGFRTHRYSPRTTRCRGGSNGAGVPRPVHAKSKTQRTMIAAPTVISARAAAFGRNSSVTPRATAIHLGMNQIQSATKSAAKNAERRSANQRLDMAASLSHRSGLGRRAREAFAPWVAPQRDLDRLRQPNSREPGGEIRHPRKRASAEDNDPIGDRARSDPIPDRAVKTGGREEDREAAGSEAAMHAPAQEAEAAAERQPPGHVPHERPIAASVHSRVRPPALAVSEQIPGDVERAGRDAAEQRRQDARQARSSEKGEPQEDERPDEDQPGPAWIFHRAPPVPANNQWYHRPSFAPPPFRLRPENRRHHGSSQDPALERRAVLLFIWRWDRRHHVGRGTNRGLEDHRARHPDHRAGPFFLAPPQARVPGGDPDRDVGRGPLASWRRADSHAPGRLRLLPAGRSRSPYIREHWNLGCRDLGFRKPLQPRGRALSRSGCGVRGGARRRGPARHDHPERLDRRAQEALTATAARSALSRDALLATPGIPGPRAADNTARNTEGEKSKLLRAPRAQGAGLVARDEPRSCRHGLGHRRSPTGKHRRNWR